MAADGTPLPAGSTLHEFRIERVLGEGGFGIVYLAVDLQLQRPVALKEYMPAALARRESEFGVVVRSERLRETFELGLRSFVNEARLLASFEHPSLVKVYRFWEQHGTAYMVMPYYEGPTLKAWLRAQPAPPDEAWLKRLLGPLLEALALIHAGHCYHRDIAPDNILLLGAELRPVLLDFGAARRVIGDATQALTTILKPGYAPIEQYAEVPAMKQGPWTDVYALCAVLYAALTGHPPMAAAGRVMNDEMVPISELAAGRYSAAFLGAIDAGLALRPEHRPQSIAALRDALFADQATVLHTVAHAGSDADADADADAVPARKGAVPPPSAFAGGRAPAANAGRRVAATLIGVAVLVAGAWFAWSRPRATDAPALVATSAPVAASAPSAAAPTATALPATPAPTAEPPGRAPFSTTALLADLVQGADPQITVRLSPDRQRLVIGRERMGFRVASSEAGHVYVFLAGTDDRHVALLFPNAIDPNNRIAVGAELALPRAGWQITAGGPPGSNHLVAIVSRDARDFSTAVLPSGGTIREFDLATLRQRWAGGAGPLLAGQASCAPPAASDATRACDGRYGAAQTRIDEVAAK